MVLAHTTSTWAQRNPTRARIRPQQRSQQLSAVARRLQHLQVTARRENLLSDLRQHQEEQARKIELIASKHGRKIDYIRKLLNLAAVYKQTRKPNLMNAIIHHKAQQLNKSLQPGQRLKMADIRDAILHDPSLDPATMDSRRKEELITNLLQHRSTQRHGVRVSNLACAQDAAHTIRRIEDAMTGMADRTGSYGFAFFSRGHLDDMAIPEWIATPGVEKFLTDVLRMDPDDIVRAFEHWAVLQGKNAEERDTNTSMRAEITKMISTGLRSILGRKAVVMSYTNYDIDIRHKYQVELVGWPLNLPFTSPSHLTTSAMLRCVRDALKSGICRWIPLTRESKEELERKVLAGEVTKKARAQRADKGVKRGPRKGKENIPPLPPTRVRRRGIQLPPVKSAALITEEEDED